MHFRNSWTRSMSRCFIRQVPSGASGVPRLELLDLLLDPEVPRHVGDQILDRRKRAHRLDGHRLVQVQLAEPRHAHQPGLAVDFRGARAALAGLAVPPHGEVRRLLGLDAVNGVEHDHAVRHLGVERLVGAVISDLPRRSVLEKAGLSSPDLEGCACSRLLLLDDVLQVVRHRRDRHARDLHRRRRSPA